MEQHISEAAPLITMVQALNNKYSEENCMIDHFAHIQLSSNQRSQGQDHKKREIVALEGCGITCAGRPGEIAQACPLICELDVTDNKITDWNEVFTIVSDLKNLRFLNLCGNPLHDWNYSPVLRANNAVTGVFNSLTELVLNSTGVSFGTVQNVLKVLPSVEDLHLGVNGYSSVPACENVFESVKRLHFNGNEIKHWEEVEKLGKMFPNLEKLVMIQNPLESTQGENKDSCLVSLKTLILINTNLGRWEDIDALRNFVSLKEVKLIGIPLVAQLKEDEARKLLVARLPNIDLLNGSRVFSKERETAERHFIREHLDAEHRPERYHELVAIHGEVSKFAKVDLAPPDFASVVMHITGRKPHLEKVSTTQTAAEFRKWISEMIHVPDKKFHLYYNDVGSPLGAEKIVYKGRTLHAYGVKDGDEFYIDVIE